MTRRTKRAKHPFEFRTDAVWDDVAQLDDGAVSRVLVVGDLHGNVSALAHARRTAVRAGAEAVVQVGDFWLSDKRWQHHGASEDYYMRYATEQFAVPLIVVDGNHEAWPSLADYATTEAGHSARRTGRPLHLGGSLWWAQRGSVWQWSQQRFGALGGAVSPDREVPDLREFRWPAEALTERDVSRLIGNADRIFGGRLDVLFTHDAPAQVTGLRSHLSGIPAAVMHEMQQTRRLLAEAVERLAPPFVLHGHWHTQHRECVNDVTEVLGLSRERFGGSKALLDLDAANGSITANYVLQ